MAAEVRTDAPRGLAAEVLALQRTIGNAGVNAVLARQAVAEPMIGPPKPPYMTWSEDEVRALQRELVRLRLYNLSVDGDLGPRTEDSLTEAFGGTEWRALDHAPALERLKGAATPKGGAGGQHRFRYAELFKDGVLDLTFGLGYLEAADPAKEAEAASEMGTIAAEFVKAMQGRGYSEDKEVVARLMKQIGRPLEEGAAGRFFVKENALTYSPPAGPSRSIHLVVRFVHNNQGSGAAAAKAFTEGMTHGDVSYYVGHGRYGTGPDFDRNYGAFRLYDDKGTLTQTIYDYNELERILAKEGKGNAWKRFEERLTDGTLKVDLTSGGNIRINATGQHLNEFGGKLTQWSLEQSKSAAVTGEGGALAKGAGSSGREYRVVVFNGCRTQDYDRAMRATYGFGTRGADIVETNRTVRGGADVQGFVAMLDALVAQKSTEATTSAMNKEMRLHEHHYSGRSVRHDRRARQPGPVVVDAQLADLVARYDTRAEGNRIELLDEMEALGGIERAAELARSEDAGTRRLAARLMGVLSDPRHVQALDALVDDPDPEVAATARASLHVQVRTPEWQALVRRLAERGDAQAEAWLAER